MIRNSDDISREKIRNDIRSNFFVEAGAGSGKTTVLVDRMVAMVEGGIPIDKICAITFTKAAAGEFYARFQKKLSETDSPAAKDALKNIDLCFMGTIDSFCKTVLSEHPAKAGIPSDASVSPEDDLVEAYLREYTSIIQGKSGSRELQEKGKVFEGCFYNAKEIFTKGFGMVSRSKNAHFNYVVPLAGKPDQVFGREREKLISILSYLAEHQEALSYDKNKKSLESYNALIESIDYIKGSWNDRIGDIERYLKALKNLRILKEYESKLDELGPGWDQIIVPKISRGKVAWYEFDQEGDPLMVERIKNYRFSIAMDFISSCLEPISQKLKAEGNLTYSDGLLNLRDLLAKDAAEGGKLIDHIYKRHSHFLIDEFQDTDPIQAEIFFYLTAQNPESDWRKCLPKAGSLFIVGDPKQSIYRFRNADVSSFIKVRSMFQNPEVGEVLFLTRNYRSSDIMCQWFNRVFGALLPEDSESQSRFSDIPLGEKDQYTATLGGVYKYTVPYYRSLDDNQDPEKIADIIRRIIENPDITIQDRDNGSTPRQPKHSDIMVITPGKGHQSHIMKAMAQAGIPFRVEGTVLFDQCKSLKALSFMMSAVADPFDRKAVFAATRLSECGITEEEVFAYAKASKTMSPASLFATLMEEKEVFAKAGTTNAEYVYFALELLRSAEEDGTVASIKDGADYIADLVNNASPEERCIQLRHSTNRVHIANLHKVKGLEAPIVILADPKKRGQEPECRVDYSKDQPESYIFKIDSALKSTDFAEEQELEKAVMEEEGIRLLYVAATRAANALIIAGLEKLDGQQSAENPWLPLLDFADESIYSVLGQYQPPAPEEKEVYRTDLLLAEAEASCVLNDRSSEGATFDVRKPSSISLKGLTSSEDDYEDKVADEFKESKQKKNPALIGTMVHRIMEVLVSSGNAVDGFALVQETVNEYQADEPYYVDMLKGVVETVRAGGYKQENGACQDILAELLSAEEVHCELPFCYRPEEDGATVIWHGIMDVVYKKEGAWHIIDYKTNADASDLDGHYQEQLKAYIKAFEEMTGQAADAMIYHIDV